MAHETLGFTATAVFVALISLLAVVVRPNKRPVDVVFAVFCGSVALAMMRPLAQEPSSWMAWVFALGGCATCNAYWLISRALFRGDEGIDRHSLGVAFATALLIIVYGLLKLSDAALALREGVGSLLTLASSTLLVLALLEPFRAWKQSWPIGERRFRIGHALLFGSSVVATVVLGDLSQSDDAWQSGYRVAAASAATLMIVHTHAALAWRRRWPTPARQRSDSRTAAETKPTADNVRLAEAIRRAFANTALHRQADLKVADLAEHLAQPEHRVSRAITQGLGERNFNQLVNRYRINDACIELREDPNRQILEIALICGFSSLGTFNRTFKAMMGCTPSEWRASQASLGFGGRPAGALEGTVRPTSMAHTMRRRC